MGLYRSTKYTPSVSPFGLPAPSEREPRRLRRSGRLRASPTVGGGNHGVVPFNEQTPPPHVRSAPFNSGMIAPGNHHFERFAALCNTLPGEARRLRRSGTGCGGSHRLQQPTWYTPSVSPFGLPAPSEREPRALRASGVTLPIPHSLLLITYAHAGGRCRAGQGTKGLHNLKASKSQRFMSGTLPGGSGNQRIGTISKRH